MLGWEQCAVGTFQDDISWVPRKKNGLKLMRWINSEEMVVVANEFGFATISPELWRSGCLSIPPFSPYVLVHLK